LNHSITLQPTKIQEKRYSRSAFVFRYSCFPRKGKKSGVKLAGDPSPGKTNINDDRKIQQRYATEVHDDINDIFIRLPL
jgi:hypothetical protein